MLGADMVIQASYFKALITSRCLLIIKRMRVKGNEQCWMVIKAPYSKMCRASLLFITISALYYKTKL